MAKFCSNLYVDLIALMDDGTGTVYPDNTSTPATLFAASIF